VAVVLVPPGEVPPVQTKYFLENIRPFVQKLAETWPGIPQRLRRRFLHELMNVLGTWFQKEHVESPGMGDAAKFAINLLQDMKTKAADLRRLFEKIETRRNLTYVRDTDPERYAAILKADPQMTSWESLIGCHFAHDILERAGRNTTPSWNIQTILAALSAMIEAAERPTGKLSSGSSEVEVELDELIRVHELVRAPAPKKRSCGRPVGIDGYQALDCLVFGLGVAAARVGINLTAYIKSGDGGAKVAAGSLIDILDMLRDCFWKQFRWNPHIPWDHQRHIATYQRLLARARSHAA
jgi:hypothetical protein